MMTNDKQMTQEPAVLNVVKVTELNEKKEVDMQRRLTWLVLLSAVIVVTALYPGKAKATPGQGFTSTPVAQGQFDAFNVLTTSFRRTQAMSGCRSR